MPSLSVPIVRLAYEHGIHDSITFPLYNELVFVIDRHGVIIGIVACFFSFLRGLPASSSQMPTHRLLLKRGSHLEALGPSNDMNLRGAYRWTY